MMASSLASTASIFDHHQQQHISLSRNEQQRLNFVIMDDPSSTAVPQQQQPFEEGVTTILVLAEELKRSLDATTVVEWQIELETILQRLDFLHRIVLDSPGDEIKSDLYNHIHAKTKTTALQVLQHISNIDVQEQAAVARMVELALVIQNNLSLTNTNNDDTDYSHQVTELYTSYQRFVLRNRCKPAIAYLATWRQQDEATRDLIPEEDDDDDEENTHIARPHSHAITIILGQASALIHPLLLWQQGLPPDSDLRNMCSKTIAVLDEQAQALCKTVSDWFWVDRKVDQQWMSQVAAVENNDTTTEIDLVELDALVEEMAFISQLLARYITLLQDSSTPTRLVQEELLPEWTWKYASLERFLARQQWKSALTMANPIYIVMGMPIQVPSVVEDAQYLSTRALERATSTLSQQAMGTVAHSISHDVWSTDDTDGGGVHQALMNQCGCWSNEDEKKNGEASNGDAPTSSGGTGSSSFASALLGALDEDLGSSSKAAVASPPASKRSSAPPTSGSFLGSLVGADGSQQQQMRLDMQLCQLNGIHSASAACTSLSQSLDDEGDDAVKTSSMIQLAREELVRYANAYQALLTNLSVEPIHEWCGSLQDTDFQEGKCIHNLRHYFHSETYELNETTFTSAEADERLERELLVPLKESRLIENLAKCDTEVTFLLCKELSSLVARVILYYLWRDKRFTDWGSLLLSKQVRMLQTYLSSLVEENALHAAKLLEEWQRVAQAVTLLQLEKPSDWAAYRGDSDVLTKEEVQKTMSLRTDFSSDAIAAVCGISKEKSGASSQDDSK